ncbi:MAG TPA: hypothetical protein VF911_07850, partial [Thermoanaerobaculia bacterium]
MAAVRALANADARRELMGKWLAHRTLRQVMTESIESLVAAVALAIVHMTAGGLTFLGAIPRSRWLSGAGGVSVAYVFLHLLPELAERR